ncbi:Rieske 2Fe-2S domain-containing protein [Dactylosporangium vinaceum]|uniref:Rieske 2Fe-2S domain-containing protein n=1 Tax=Dactylosporangium vinaceum TaxID=53362 RepID=A0ABV5MBB8_9ACTN|nr:Rieske (2Fe-2S) protein [Dactylosporangium vinaceum]UAB98397.1 Rieske 2Fe-2S domain-containing protein [Dactylosporangium vinaceum]
MPEEDVFNLCSARSGRRALLLGASAMGVAVLAGCGGDDAAPPSAAGSPGGSSAPAAPATTGGNPFDDGGSSGGAGQQVPGNSLIGVGEVPVGGGVIVKDSVLVLQPTKGAFKAYEAACPHEGAILDPPFDGNPIIMCPRHNSKFKVADGSKVSGPTPRGLKGIKVDVKSGYVVRS